MFEYSTETIINDNIGRLVKKKGEQPVRFYKDEDNNVIYIDGVGRFEVANIKCVTKREFEDENNEKIVINIPASKAAKDDIVRLVVKTRQIGLTSSIYKDAQLRSVKPFYYEIKVKDASKLAEELAALVSKEMALTDFNFFKAVGDGMNLTLTADDCYTHFEEIEIVRRNLEDCISCQNYGILGDEKGEEIFAWKHAEGDTNEAVTSFDEGTEGSGTVRRIIKNLRIPTLANTDPFGLDFGGKPVPGGQYDMYTFEYVTRRHNVGHDVMGSIGHSITTHTVYVNAVNKTSEEFEKMFDDVIEAVGAGKGNTISEKKPEHSQVG